MSKMDRSLSYSADDIKLIANKRLIEFTVTPVYPTIFMCGSSLGHFLGNWFETVKTVATYIEEKWPTNHTTDWCEAYFETTKFNFHFLWIYHFLHDIFFVFWPKNFEKCFFRIKSADNVWRFFKKSFDGFIRPSIETLYLNVQDCSSCTS